MFEALFTYHHIFRYFKFSCLEFGSFFFEHSFAVFYYLMSPIPTISSCLSPRESGYLLFRHSVVFIVSEIAEKMTVRILLISAL